MVFSSQVFVFFFLGLSLALYYATPRGGRALTLTVLSYAFYGWWKPIFTSLMLASTIVDYFAAGAIGRAQARGKTGRPILLVSIVLNLGLLGFFKYADFGIRTINALGLHPGSTPIELLGIVLPVGISFYTFQSMSYTIDVYRRQVEPARRFVDFACYVALFPQLVAGPIVRYSSIADQLVTRTHTLEKFLAGVLCFQTGFAKKVLIADLVAGLADNAFAAPGLSILDAWTGIVAYAFQIYFDFSGYSDMAIGLGLMLGFRFPRNFDRPYLATSITDFWRRWHISLSTWLRDYLYIPLGGNRHGSIRTYVNLLLTMLLGGLWHGANWTFIAWGAYQGLWLAVEKRFGAVSPLVRWPKPLRIGLTFVVVLVGWVFFRAPDMDAALAYLAAMFGVSGGGFLPLEIRPLHLVGLGVGALVTWGFPATQTLVLGSRLTYVLATQPLFVLALLHLNFQDYVPFLYYQF